MMPRLDSIFSSTPDVLSLAYIRSILQRLEDTILFQLIERGQSAHNAAMYRPGAFKELREKEGWDKSWVEWFLKETESAHAKLRRWQAPDEYPFTDIALLPQPILPPVKYPEVLYPPAIVTVNDQIYQHYRDELVPALTSRFGLVSWMNPIELLLSWLTTNLYLL
jgi:chorismate mutase